MPMSHSYSADEILEMLMGLATQGRGGGAVDINRPPFSTKRKHEAAHKPKKRASAAQKKYGRVFKRISPRYKKKSGGWKKNGFKACVRAAHKECRKGR